MSYEPTVYQENVLERVRIWLASDLTIEQPWGGPVRRPTLAVLAEMTWRSQGMMAPGFQIIAGGTTPDDPYDILGIRGEEASLLQHLQDVLLGFTIAGNPIVPAAEAEEPLDRAWVTYVQQEWLGGKIREVWAERTKERKAAAAAEAAEEVALETAPQKGDDRG